MSLRTGNATRDRILADRDAFRDGWKAEQQQKQNTPPVAPAAAQPVQPQVTPQPAEPAPQQPQVKAVPPEDIPVPDDFINTVNSMGGLNVPTQQQEPQENPELKAMREENAKLVKELEELRKARESDSASLRHP